MNSSKRYRHCVLATCCVPWDARFEFEEDIFRRSVRHLIKAGIHDLYIFGTAGEGYAVTDSQFDAVTLAFLEETRADGVQGMVGIISQSLPVMIERIGRARDMGARRFQISLPGWGVLSDGEMQTFFRETCARFSDCEFLHYNLMRTGRILTGSEYAVLADVHPNLVATKNSTADETRLRSLIIDAPQLQHFITEAGFVKASLMGECGLLISVASINLALGKVLFRAGCDRDQAVLARMSDELAEIVCLLKEAVAGSAHMDGAFDKMFCKAHDATFPLRLLPPYSHVSDDLFGRFLDLVREHLPHWLTDAPLQ